MCCSRIRVTLNGVVKDKKDEFAGTYQKASVLINKRSYWNKIDGDGASGSEVWREKVSTIYPWLGIKVRTFNIIFFRKKFISMHQLVSQLEILN